MPLSTPGQCRARKRVLGGVNEADRLFHPTRFVTAFLRQAALFNVTLTADEWLRRLTLECRNKAGGVKQPIGFVHSP